jgi:hypothetical protein
MDAQQDNIHTVQIAKRIHGIMSILYGIGAAIFLFGFTMTQSDHLSQVYLFRGLVLSLLLGIHLLALIAWDIWYPSAKAITSLVAVIMLFAIPLGTLLGIILLYKMNKFTYPSKQKPVA